MHVTIQRNKADFATLPTDRIAPTSDLKVAADAYAVQIVDASRKARNGNFTMQEAARNIADGRRQIAQKWAACETTSITGKEAELAQTAKAEMARPMLRSTRCRASSAGATAPG